MEVFHPLQLLCGVWGSLLALCAKNMLPLEAEIHLFQPVSYTLHTAIKTVEMGEGGGAERDNLIWIPLHKYLTQKRVDLLFKKVNTLVQVALGLRAAVKVAPPFSLTGREMLLDLCRSSFRQVELEPLGFLINPGESFLTLWCPFMWNLWMQEEEHVAN